MREDLVHQHFDKEVVGVKVGYIGMLEERDRGLRSERVVLPVLKFEKHPYVCGAVVFDRAVSVTGSEIRHARGKGRTAPLEFVVEEHIVVRNVPADFFIKRLFGAEGQFRGDQRAVSSDLVFLKQIGQFVGQSALGIGDGGNGVALVAEGELAESFSEFV